MFKFKTTVIVLLVLSAGACALAAGGEAATEEQSIFSGTFADSLWTLIAFVLLLVILTKVAWKPLVKQLQARQDYIKQQIDAADTSRKNAGFARPVQTAGHRNSKQANCAGAIIGKGDGQQSRQRSCPDETQGAGGH